MAINWNEVTVGETEIEIKGFHKKIIIGVFQDYVWVNDRGGNYDTYHKDALATWTIYDPWEEVSEECVIIDYGNIDHNGHIINYIDFEHGRYRRSKKGLRVWKRKEGW